MAPPRWDDPRAGPEEPTLAALGMHDRSGMTCGRSEPRRGPGDQPLGSSEAVGATDVGGLVGDEGEDGGHVGESLEVHRRDRGGRRGAHASGAPGSPSCWLRYASSQVGQRLFYVCPWGRRGVGARAFHERGTRGAPARAGAASFRAAPERGGYIVGAPWREHASHARRRARRPLRPGRDHLCSDSASVPASQGALSTGGRLGTVVRKCIFICERPFTKSGRRRGGRNPLGTRCSAAGVKAKGHILPNGQAGAMRDVPLGSLAGAFGLAIGTAFALLLPALFPPR